MNVKISAGKFEEKQYLHSSKYLPQGILKLQMAMQ